MAGAAGRQRTARAYTSSSSSLAVSFITLLVAALLGEHVSTTQSVPAAAQVPVRVGVILDLASAVSLRRRTGIKMAVEDYYAAYPGSATRVELHSRNSGGDAVGAASTVERGDFPCFESLPAFFGSGRSRRWRLCRLVEG